MFARVTLKIIYVIISIEQFQDCDPVSAGLIPANDAIVPFFVSQQLAYIPGLSGLFIACLFSGALSTLDSGKFWCKSL
jgi:hypothetical protein